MNSTAAEALVPFGFTALESEIYAFLLKESPATGYRIAQAIGKPAANTYKAIQSLEAKGAVLVDEGSTRMCRAVAYDELLNRLARQFEEQRVHAAATFASIEVVGEDDRVYSLRSREQVVQLCRQMIAEAEVEIHVCAEAKLVKELQQEISNAVSKGIRVDVLSADASEIDGVEVTKPFWRGGVRGEVRIVADGVQSIVANFDGEALAQAFWTRNPFLTNLHHRSLVSERTVSMLDAQLKDDDKRSRMMKTIDQARVDLEAKA